MSRRVTRSQRRRGGFVVTAAVVIVVVLVLAAVVTAGLYWKYVIEEPGDHISAEAIDTIIAQESPVYFRDGVTPIGVFFAQEHRIYVPYEEIPPEWSQAITSAEDKRFFDHGGLDPKGFARAMWQNMKAGGVVAGGSTLTMQTAENLYYDGVGDQWSAKMVEAVNTLRLEAHFEKEDILEFYANQFHVSGNGRGIGIAARYFFDKEVGDLTLQECAFVAGLVKAPYRYNPFVGSEERREGARDKALTRTNYVLGRMVEDGHIEQAQFDALKAAPVPFKRGTFRYDSSVLLDEVQRRLELAPFPQLFEEAGIENPSTAGIQIITTLDAVAQRSATYGMWHHLTDAGTLLEGQGVDAFFHPQVAINPVPERPETMSFHHARVTGGDKEGVKLDIGGHEGVLDRGALERAYLVLAHARAGNTWTQPTDADKQALRKALSVDAVVWVSVRPGAPTDPSSGPLICDLEIRPELQGGLIALEDGQIRAMVGGNDNRNFNRAVTAKRQLGSTWKSLVYFAALQLGWTPVDALDNRQGVFPFEGTWYYPNPDHKPSDFVSLAWAGVQSENLASIWLLYHLTDRLNPEQIRRLAELTDLAPRDGEGERAYIERIRDTHGVIATGSRLEAGLLNAVKEPVMADLAFAGHPEDAVEVLSLHYGLGFDDERKRVKRGYGGAERERRLAALDHSLTHYEGMLEGCQEQADDLADARDKASKRRSKSEKGSGAEDGKDGKDSRDKKSFFGRKTPPRRPTVAPVVSLEVEDVDQLSWKAVEAKRGRSGKQRKAAIHLSCGREAEGYEPIDADFLESLDALGEVAREPLLDGRIHASTVRAVRESIDEKKDALGAAPEYYDPELLYLHPDFRVMLGLKYMAGLTGAFGVDEEMPPVVSMPLGALEISLEQAATLYQGFLRGERWSFPGAWMEESAIPGLDLENDLPSPELPTLLIAEIRDSEGNVLYKAEPEPEPVADPVSGLLVADVLRNVVVHGTGRRASGMLGGWPVGGKTGTTNDFKNAAFIGYVPAGEGSPWVLASYVGYDDNRPMVRTGSVLAGANGALPAWIGAIEGFAGADLLGERPEEAEVLRGFERAAVAAGTGLPTDDDSAGEVLVYGTAARPLRRFAPFTERAEDTEAAPEVTPGAPAADPDPGADVEGDMEDPSLDGGSVWDGIE